MMISRKDTHRGIWIGVALVLSAIGLAAAGFAVWSLDPDTLKPRLVEAAERATGRTLTISGKVGIKLSLVPTLRMDDVALSNPPGASRADLVKVGHVEVSFALIPLLRHHFEIDRISLERPDILLERDAAGHPNWLFARPAAQSPAPPSEVPGPSGRERFAVSVNNISIVDGHIAWLDQKSGRRLEAEIPRLTASAPVDGLMQVAGTATYAGQTIGLSGRTTPPRDPAAVGDAAAWPMELTLASGGAGLKVEGQIARPLEGRGYKFTIDGDLPNPAEFNTWFPRLPLASVQGVTTHAEVNDAAGTKPVFTALTIRMRAIDLGVLEPGARLEDVALTGRGAEPLKLSARVVIAGSDSGIGGQIGDLAWLNGGASGPIAVDLEWNAASARASVKGTIQRPKRFSGFALDVAVDVPDPSLVVPGAPPALKSVAFRTRLTDEPGAIPFQATSNAGDLAGELSISRTPRLSVEGHISSHHLDLDALRVRPVTQPAPPATVMVEPTARESATPLISDRKLKLDAIRTTDANVKFSLDQVRLSGLDLGAVSGALSMKDGLLRLDPFTMTSPDRHQSGSLVVDASANPPAVHLSVDAPGLLLGPLLDMLELPRLATGSADLHADLNARGESPRALAASLDGWAGVAVEGGQMDAALVNSWLDQLRPLHINGADITDLRCFAVRATVKGGIATLQPAALNTAAVIIDGGGDVDLGNETLALKLRPRAKIGGTGIALPVRVSGKMRSPTAKVDISPSSGGAGALADLLLGSSKQVMGADPCPDALAHAREGAPTPQGGTQGSMPGGVPGGVQGGSQPGAPHVALPEQGGKM